MSHRTFNDPHGTSDFARQSLLDNRAEHKPKRHRTKGRRIRLSKAKRQRVKAHLALQVAERRKHVAAVRSYWMGMGDHPCAVGAETLPRGNLAANGGERG